MHGMTDFGQLNIVYIMSGLLTGLITLLEYLPCLKKLIKCKNIKAYYAYHSLILVQLLFFIGLLGLVDSVTSLVSAGLWCTLRWDLLVPLNFSDFRIASNLLKLQCVNYCLLCIYF